MGLKIQYSFATLQGEIYQDKYTQRAFPRTRPNQRHCACVRAHTHTHPLTHIPTQTTFMNKSSKRRALGRNVGQIKRKQEEPKGGVPGATKRQHASPFVLRRLPRGGLTSSGSSRKEGYSANKGSLLASVHGHHQRSR